MNYTRQQLLAMTIYGEARNQSILGQVLVAQVVMNRWLNPSWWGTTLEEILFKPEQFDCWKEGNVNRQKTIDAMESMAQGNSNKAIKQAMWIADGVLLGKVIDNSHGANHYYNVWTQAPFWSKGQTPVIMEGDHAFYKL